MRIFGREPAVVLGAVAAVLAVVVGIFPTSLSTEQSGVIVAFIAAAWGVFVAWKTRPVPPSVVTAFIVAGGALLAAFHFDVSQDVLGTISGAALAILALVSRAQITPQIPLRAGGSTVGQDDRVA